MQSRWERDRVFNIKPPLPCLPGLPGQGQGWEGIMGRYPPPSRGRNDSETLERHDLSSPKVSPKVSPPGGSSLERKNPTSQREMGFDVNHDNPNEGLPDTFRKLWPEYLFKARKSMKIKYLIVSHRGV
jgi:hypothetical protein